MVNMPLETNISNVPWPAQVSSPPPTTQHAVSTNSRLLVFKCAIRVPAACVFVLLYVDGWRLIMWPFCSKSKPRDDQFIFISIGAAAGTPKKNASPSHMQPSGEMMSERELRGEDKGCVWERCSFCTLLADLNKRRKINNTPRGCLSSSVCSTRSLTHSLSLSLSHTHRVFFTLWSTNLLLFSPSCPKLFSALAHIVWESWGLSHSLSSIWRRRHLRADSLSQ